MDNLVQEALGLEIANQSLSKRFETMRKTLIAERQANAGLKARHNKLLLLARDQSPEMVDKFFLKQ